MHPQVECMDPIFGFELKHVGMCRISKSWLAAETTEMVDRYREKAINAILSQVDLGPSSIIDHPKSTALTTAIADVTQNMYIFLVRA